MGFRDLPGRAIIACLMMIAGLVGCGSERTADLPVPPESEPDPWDGLEMVENLPEPVALDFDEVDSRDTLRALVVSNSTSYFLYRGEPMGLEFELLREFADFHGLVLDPIVVRDRLELFRRLNRGDGDIVAARLPLVDAFRPHVLYSRPLYMTRPTLVQRVEPVEAADLEEPVDTILEAPPEEFVPLESLRSLSVSVRRITRPRQLRGDTVHLRRASSYYPRLVELSDTLGGTLEVVELEEALSDERLIRGVARGEISFTVSQENLARLSEEYFSNIEVRPVMGRMHSVSWAVRTSSPALRDSLDAWLGREENLRSRLYDKYFVDRAGYRERLESDFLTSETGRLSRYDSLFIHYSREIGWDWRLLAAQAFQESRFNPRARSWAGARGLLQLMPGTARDLRVRDSYDPEQNVRGATRYLEWLDELWSPKISDPDERLRFVLGSYNAGFGHVEDARRLADKYGDDPDDWDDVAYWLLQLSKRSVNRDPVVRYGWVRGIEPVTYVERILERYRHYSQLPVSASGPTLLQYPGAASASAS